MMFAKEKVNAESFAALAAKRYGDQSAEFLKLYPAGTDDEALKSAYAYSTGEQCRVHHVEMAEPAGGDRQARVQLHF